MSTEPESSIRNGKTLSFFKICIGDFFDKLRIPPAFVKHLPDSITSQEVVLWNSARNFWHVHAEHCEEDLYLRNGWREFVQDNFIELGDFLLFLHVGNSDFDVCIYGRDCCEKEVVVARENIKKSLSCEDNQDDEVQWVRKDNQQRCRKAVVDVDLDGPSENEKCTPLSASTTGTPSAALEAANKFVSEYPSFKVVMRHAYVKRGFLHLPMFLKQHIKAGEKSVSLQLLSKSWPVKLVTSPRVLRLSSGWRNFAADNYLQVGDVCIFELIEADEFVLLRVSIYRASIN